MKTCIWIFVDIWDLQFFYILLVVQESSFRLLFANLKLRITRYQQIPSSFRIHVYVCGGHALTTVHTFRTLCANFLSIIPVYSLNCNWLSFSRGTPYIYAVLHLALLPYAVQNWYRIGGASTHRMRNMWPWSICMLIPFVSLPEAICLGSEKQMVRASDYLVKILTLTQCIIP